MELSSCTFYQYGLITSQVICKQCNHCRDIDLCKDPHQSQLSDVDKTPVWVCASAGCGAAYDTAEIEHQLVDALQRKSMGFTLQDLQVCTKCVPFNRTNHCLLVNKLVIKLELVLSVQQWV